MQASPRVRHAQVDRLRVILDLERASYRVLDDVASAMWSALVGERRAVAVLAELTAAYDAPLAVLERDLERFGARCVAEGLLIARAEVAAVTGRHGDGDGDRHGDADRYGDADRHGDAGRPRGPVRWHWLAALRSLLTTNRCLAREGLGRAYERAAGVPLGVPRIALARAAAAFLAAENVYVSRRGPDDCLGRSLALFAYLRAAGHPAEHVIGVRRIPFKAHAWVECAGDVVLDRRFDGFVPLARLGG